MFIRIFITIYIVFSIQSLKAQKIEVYTGVHLFNEVHLGMFKKLHETRSIGVSATCMLRFSEKRYWETAFGTTRIMKGARHQGGPGLSLHNRWDTKKEFIKGQMTLEYRHLKSGLYISDVGRYGGSNTTPYSEFVEFYDNVALIFSRHKISGDKGQYSFYYELGPILRIVRREYSVTGSPAQHVPSSAISYENRFYMVFRLGWNFGLFGYGKEITKDPS
ncbi:MAG: hypothetical protein OEY51_04525 [Cyclobacteriaceae bacterium]|nr:hypothetical protein [Cyclobacteriaceae bacterium]